MPQKRCACGFGIDDHQIMCDGCKLKDHIKKRSIGVDQHQISIVQCINKIVRNKRKRKIATPLIKDIDLILVTIPGFRD